ncbi:MAG: 23S rRNA (adenine(2503)-C(2))-methyltransferase RlmN [Planctomycetaceae bacterium]|nr:23S rRNA (adenine(2503)-C(2))-methyltransferase RlmN [Planctomycetaceae bacterium]
MHWLEATGDRIVAFMRDAGQPSFRAKQALDWLHGKRVASFDDMVNIPATLRSAMASAGRLRVLHQLERRDADDGLTSKWLFRGDGDEDFVESVLIVEKRRTRRTVCVSCMVGCPLACAFCATGQGGFGRNLGAGEIIEQGYAADELARAQGDGGLTHVVFMGMGEPLLTLDAVLRAADTFADPAGLGLSGRHITISTAGVPEGIRRLAESGRTYRLALSLHAADQRLREKIMPIAKRHPLPEVITALEQFAETASRDITFEYCLMKGVNDSLEDARRVAALTRPFGGRINLIPMNGVTGAAYAPPSPSVIRRFQEELERSGLSAPVRMEKGADIGAACGQLRAEKRGR